MNHKAIVQHESERPYTQRTFQCWKLDRYHFDALNTGGTVLDLNGYCLDALDEIPAGCMRPIAWRPAQHYVVRGVSLAEQQALEALADELIAEIIAEERP